MFPQVRRSRASGRWFRRRVRIGTGGYQSLSRLWRLLCPDCGWTAFAFLSHKLLRWLVPFFLLAMAVSNVLLLEHPFYQAMFAAQAAAFSVSLVGAYVPGRGLPVKMLRAMAMFTSMNLALLVGFWRWLTMKQTGTWQRTDRNSSRAERERLGKAPEIIGDMELEAVRK